MEFSFKDGVFALEAFGCYVKIEDGVIFAAPMYADGTYHEEDWYEVTEPEKGFLEALRFHDK